MLQFCAHYLSPIAADTRTSSATPKNQASDCPGYKVLFHRKQKKRASIHTIWVMLSCNTIAPSVSSNGSDSANGDHLSDTLKRRMDGRSSSGSAGKHRRGNGRGIVSGPRVVGRNSATINEEGVRGRRQACKAHAEEVLRRKRFTNV